MADKYPSPSSMGTSGSSSASLGTGWTSTKYGLSAEDPLAKFMDAPTAYAQSTLFNQVMASLSGKASPTPGMNMFDYIQTQLRRTGRSKGTTAIGIADNEDISAFSKALQGAVAMNIPKTIGGINYYQDILGVLTSYLDSQPAAAGNVPKVPIPQYSKLISTALQYKDAGDAAQALNDAYFLAWGAFPSKQDITDFQDKWNAERTAQMPKKTTTDVVTPTPKKDKNGKVMKDKNGNILYEYTTKTDTVTSGEDFTAEEQKQFLANYIVQHAPNQKWDMATLGGSAKSIYDDIANTYRNNFLDVPDINQLKDIIIPILAAGDEKVQKELADQAKANIRKAASKNWAGFAQDMLDSNTDASTFLNPIITNLSKTLGTTIDQNDPLIKKIINFKDKNGNVRVANAEEQNALLFDDGRIWNTSTYRNMGVDIGQALQSKLGR